MNYIIRIPRFMKPVHYMKQEKIYIAAFMKYLQTSRTPGVFEMATQLKLKHFIELEPENEMYCK